MDLSAWAKIYLKHLKESASKIPERAVVFLSGGVDSSLILKILFDLGKEPSAITLYSFERKSKDLPYALYVSKIIGVPHFLLPIRKKDLMIGKEKLLSLFPNLGFVKADVLVPIFLGMRFLSSLGKKDVVFGASTEECFAGYQRHWEFYEKRGIDYVKDKLREEFEALFSPGGDIHSIKKLGEYFSIKTHFPYADRELFSLAMEVLEYSFSNKDLKKYPLRIAAKEYGLPEEIVWRKKLALQYGTGTHDLFKKIWET